MHRLFALLFMALLLSMASSCSTLEPDGSVKGIVDGKIFEGGKPEHIPPDNTRLEPLEKPPMRWKVDL